MHLRLTAVMTLLALSNAARAADNAQWGERFSRNMVSDETGLPDGFDPESGANLKWSVPLGSDCYSSPVVSQGKVFLGVNNERPRDPRHQGDRGVMFCLNESDGSLAWQLIVPKLDSDKFLDWPRAGMCSPATVEGNKVYTVTNRDEVVCLDLHGMANGNDGPFQDEARHQTPHDMPLVEVGPLDADILWLLDLRTAAGVRPHDSAHCSVLVDGPYLYINTSNGLTSKHDGVDKPEAPALVVVEKATGRLLAREREGISQRIFHSAWSSPALGVVDGRRLIFHGGGDAVVYAFDAWNSAPSDEIESLRLAWRFDCDPTAPKENVHQYIRNRNVSPSFISSMPVFHDNRIYVTVGGDIWWGKHEAWLKCIDATGEGDITDDALLWSYPVERHCCSTPSVHEGLVYVADCGGKMHCVDAKTGKGVWVHDIGRETWASTLVADGKVYIGGRGGDFWTLAAGREKRVLGHVKLDSAVISTSTAANGTLYVGTMTRLYAVARSGQ